MYTSNSFGGYGKKSESEEREYRRKKRRRIIIIGVSTAVLVFMIGAVVGTVVNKHDDKPRQRPSSSTASAIKSVCNVTQYPDSCYESFSSTNIADTDPEQLFKLSLKIAMDAISNVTSLPDDLSKLTTDKSIQGALNDCTELLYDAIDRLNESTTLLNPVPGEKLLTPSKISTLRSWLSATITDQVTCLDGLENTNNTVQQMMSAAMVNTTQYTSNSLAIVTKILSHFADFELPANRKLLTTTSVSSAFPDWVSDARKRMLLQASPRLTPSVTVAKDGKVKTISQALALVPNKNKNIFVIYIKAGVYDEIVKVEKNKWNVVMYGDGMYKTIVTGSLNAAEGVQTFDTATFTVVGKNFMARDMTFENHAGPVKEQAVALRSSSDFSVFYRCSFVGFQDTLYAHSNRQFYRDCEITGTVDFIFGDASAVFQNCRILPRQPLPNQKNTITAQGRTDPNEPTGFSIQSCTITPLDKVTVPTYLGRPWKQYSTTVIMQSNIGGVIRPEGWFEWFPGLIPPKTIYYGEYQNTGPGAAVSKRVKWPGYRPAISTSEARRFAVETFISGNDWLPGTGVEFKGSTV